MTSFDAALLLAATISNFSWLPTLKAKWFGK